ncbi:ISAs1 family transposase [Pleurocapsales cyanobacterium LEGE 06147]|nr:ISAs1 family transposase [Pleurocapsales cyanobacterium LEGE 06147]
MQTTRNRLTTRTVEVFDDLNGIDPSWVGIKSLIQVSRTGTRADKPSHQVVCYISSLIHTAQEFTYDIRSHWCIENCLHWVKDVVFQENDSKIRMGNAPANLSLLRAIALNILRRNGHASITTAQRFLSHDLDKLLALVE